MKKEFRLTDDGMAELKTELEKLEAQKPAIAEKIRVAREQGDLAENAEYQIAKDELSRVETRIAEIKRVLLNAEIVKDSKHTGTVRLGSKVRLKDDSQTVSYHIVGSFEADPSENKISDESPIGKALMGKKVGDSTDITTPAGTISYKITGIS